MIAAATGTAGAKTSDAAKAKAWAKAHYKSKVVKVVGYHKVPMNRGGVVYIEKIKTKAKGGKVGKTSDGKTVRYPKRVKRGKRITMYLVYSPYSNSPDDVVAVVACGKFK